MEFSAEEEKLLHHEELVAAILDKRQKDQPHADFTWAAFLQSAGGAALITVAIGGLFGTLLTAMIQAGLKERDFQQSWLKARGDQAIVAYKEYLDGELKIVERTYGTSGRMVAATDDVISLSHPQFDPSRYPDSRQRDLFAQKAAIRHEFNLAQADWRKERGALGFLISYYHRGTPQVRDSWREVEAVIDRLSECVERWTLNHAGEYSTLLPCQAERQSIDGKLLALSGGIEAVRRYAWEGWESPSVMRGLLEAADNEQAKGSSR